MNPSQFLTALFGAIFLTAHDDDDPDPPVATAAADPTRGPVPVELPDLELRFGSRAADVRRAARQVQIDAHQYIHHRQPRPPEALVRYLCITGICPVAAPPELLADLDQASTELLAHDRGEPYQVWVRRFRQLPESEQELRHSMALYMVEPILAVEYAKPPCSG